MGNWNGFILDYCPSREKFIVVLHRGAADDMTATNFYQYPWSMRLFLLRVTPSGYLMKVFRPCGT